MTTYTVSNSSELYSAIQSLSYGGGGTIRVAAGDEPYVLEGYRLGHAEETIRIIADDPENPPNFDQVKLIQSQNLSFEGLVFDGTVEDTVSGKDVQISEGNNIVFTGNSFYSTANGYYDGSEGDMLGGSLGYFRDSSGVTFSDNYVSEFYQGLTIINSVDTEITGNAFTKMTGDAIRMTGVQNTLVEGNEFSAFYGTDNSFNHDDMIQVWSASYTTLNTENLIIRDNVINTSGGSGNQSIFIKNEKFSATGEEYQNIVIEGNLIYNARTNGIAVYDTDGVSISNNTLLWNTSATDGTGSPPSIRLYNVNGGSVTENIASSVYTSGSSGLDISNNQTITYSNTYADNYVGNHFVNVTDAGVIDLRDMALLPDSSWLAEGLGSNLASIGAEGEEVTAVIRQESSTTVAGGITFDASLSQDSTGILGADAQYIWTFADGTVLEGVSVSKVFDTAGVHTARLTVITEHGTAVIERTAEVEPDLLFDMSMSEGISDTSSFGTAVTASGGYLTSGESFLLDGGSKIRIDSDAGQLRSFDSMTIDMTLKIDDGSFGVFLHRHYGFTGEITSDNRFKFTTATKEMGSISLQSEAGVIEDGAWHRLTVSYNGAPGGEVALYVDGELVASAPATGLISPTRAYDIVLGNTWNESLKGEVGDLDIYATAKSQEWLLGIAETVTPVDDPADEPAIETPVEQPADDPADEPVTETPIEQPALGQAVVQDGPVIYTNYFEPGSVGNIGEFSFPSKTESEGGYFDLGRTSKFVFEGSEALLKNTESFSISLSFRQDAGDDAGSIFHMHYGIWLQSSENGAMTLNLATTDGWFDLTTETGLLSKGDWHDIAVSYEDGTLLLFLDDVEVGREAVTGVAMPNVRHDLNLGKTWGRGAEGDVDNIVITLGTADLEYAPASETFDALADESSLNSLAYFSDTAGDAGLFV